MILNTLHLEWYLYKDGTHSKYDFDKTLESLVIPINNNVKDDDDIKFIVRNFNEIFVDFPDDFKRAVMDCINKVLR
jgi:hypothetical protein